MHTWKSRGLPRPAAAAEPKPACPQRLKRQFPTQAGTGADCRLRVFHAPSFCRVTVMLSTPHAPGRMIPNAGTSARVTAASDVSSRQARTSFSISLIASTRRRYRSPDCDLMFYRFLDRPGASALLFSRHSMSHNPFLVTHQSQSGDGRRWVTSL